MIKAEELEFVECDMCMHKPGSPILCNSCLANRSIIETLKSQIRDLKAEIVIDDNLLEQRNRILQAIPSCEIHGNLCISHAIEWIERVKTFGEIIFNNK